MKKFLLGALTAGQELHVVENQCVDPAELVLELPHPFAPNRVYQFIHEGLGRHEQHLARTRAQAPQMVPDSSCQMRLAKSDATVNKERVIFLARPLGYRLRGGVRELIARPDDEFCEREAGVQLRIDSHQLAVTCPAARWDG